MSMRPGGPMTAFLDRARALKPGRGLLIIVPALLGILLIATAVRSLEWRAGPGLAGLLYQARMADQRGMVPYRDLFSVDAPGVFTLYALVGRLTGYSDGAALSAANLAALAGIMALTWGWLRRLGELAGWTAAIVFGLCCLSFGPFEAILAPEVWIVLLLAGAMFLAAGLPSLGDRLRCGLIGLLFGLVATIEPHALVGAIPVGIFLWIDLRERSTPGAARTGQIAGFGLGGLALPWLALVIALAAGGALGAYRDILSGYAPLFAHITANLRVIGEAGWGAYAFGALIDLGKQAIWLAPGGVGLLAAVTVGGLDARGRRTAALALAMGGAMTLYPLLAARFDSAHWLPALYFLIALASLCFLPVRDAGSGWFLRAFLPAVLILTLFFAREVVAGLAAGWVDRYAKEQMPAPPAEGRADAVAAYLRANLKPGDRVQPLDWNGGVVQGMLLADAPPATRFTADMLFLQNTSTPAIQALQSEFTGRLEADPPRYMIYVPGYRFQGGAVSADFPALRAVLDARYRLVFAGDGFLVYERSERGDPAGSGLIVYPHTALPDSDGYLGGVEQAALGLTGPIAEDPQKLDEALAGFASGRGTLIAELGGDDAGAAQIVAWLDGHGSKQAEQSISGMRVLEYRLNPAAP